MPQHFGHYAKVPPAAWPWLDFKPEEIASRGDGSIIVDEAALERLQRARVIAGEAFVILSAYRDPIHNAKVGGAPLSLHKAGRAFDIALRGHDRSRLLQACRDAGFTGFGFYKTFLHVDTGRRRQWGTAWT